MSTPDYVLTEDVSVVNPSNKVDSLVLHAGTFIKPIDLYYVPKHVRSHDINKWHNDTTHVFCYTRIGIVSILRKHIRKV